MQQKRTIDHVLRATWQAVAKMYNEEAAKADSTMATGFALLSIDPDEGTPSTALGPRMGMEATSLSRILNSMEERGLIARKPHPNDRRSVLIHLTDLGLEKRAVSREFVLQFNNRIREEVDQEALNQFYSVIDTIQNLVNSKQIFNNTLKNKL
ncbi:MAG: MarR family transcriptional regulator [Flavobacteriaceae bacterium]|jgi:DNA-binding MarR family transcriptional regulator|nr:MarR family transcriptional regulator [Flavobacteriaceae bacterium]